MRTRTTGGQRERHDSRDPRTASLALGSDSSERLRQNHRRGPIPLGISLLPALAPASIVAERAVLRQVEEFKLGLFEQPSAKSQTDRPESPFVLPKRSAQ